MANASDIYVKVLRELDKYESPSFNVKDFEYFFNDAVNIYVSNHLLNADVLQKDSDDIDYFITWDEKLTQDPTNKSKFALPVTYRHVWGVKAEFEFLSDFGKYKGRTTTTDGDKIILYPKRRRTTREGYQEKNAYHKPSLDYPYYKVEGGSIYIDAGLLLEPSDMWLDYVKIPAEYTVSPTDSVVSIPDHVIRELVKLTARRFAENIESPRYGSMLQEEQLRKE